MLKHKKLYVYSVHQRCPNCGTRATPRFYSFEFCVTGKRWQKTFYSKVIDLDQLNNFAAESFLKSLTKCAKSECAKSEQNPQALVWTALY